MTPADELLDRCRRAGVRLSAKDGGRTLRYDAPGDIDPGLKADLRRHKAEVLARLARGGSAEGPGGATPAAEPARPRLFPGWYTLPHEPKATFNEGATGRRPVATLPTVAVVLAGVERVVRQLPAGEPLPANVVLWCQPGGNPQWTPGPAHALGSPAGAGG